MSGVGVSTITPPELASVRGEDIVKFELAYERYVRQITEVTLNRTTAQRITPAGMKACVSAELLISLTRLRTFPGCVEVSDVSDTDVRTWVKDRSPCSVDDMASHVEDAVARVKFRPDRSDPKGATLQFFTDLTMELRRNRVSHAITEASKALIILLMPKLEPSVLRESIQSAHEYWPKEVKYNFHYFMKRVTEVSVESAKYDRKRDRDEGSSEPKKHYKKHKKHKKHKPISQGESKEHVKAVAKPRVANAAAGPQPPGKWKLKCLNLDCDEYHPIRDCGITTDEDKEKLLNEYREKKKKRDKAKKIAVFREKDASDGRWCTVVEDTVNCVALGDIGADESAVPRSLIREIERDGQTVNATPLEEVMQLSPAVKLPTSLTITASAKALLRITISLPCGPLRLRGVEFLIVDQEMDEILLGRPLLQKLGFDLEQFLTANHSRLDNTDVSSVQPFQGRDGRRLCILQGYRGLWYNKTEDDPIQLPESVSADVVDEEEDIRDAFREILNNAAQNKITKEGGAKLQAMMNECRDIFRIGLILDPPAKVEPMEIRLKEGCRPVRATQRRYSDPERAFIEKTIRRLEKAGAVYHNPKAKWASPALAVAKPGTEKFRFTVDLRAPNRETVPIASAMPDFWGMLKSTRCSKVFGKLDMCHAYWQVPLHPSSQECMSIQTPIGVFTPTRSLQGSTDAGNHFQAATSQVFTEIEKLLQWKDDFLLYEETEAALLNNLQRFFNICREKGLKLHAQKAKLFMREAKFCGRVIDAECIRYDPRGLDALMHMRRPTVASDLQQFLCAANWMRNSIPDYSRLISSLHKLMKECYAKANKRTKQAVRKVALSGLWGKPHEAAFSQIKTSIAQKLKLAHLKEESTVCLFSDASETHWASILTQVPKEQMSLEIEKQDHEPLSFLSGSFNGASANWSIVEKEAFAVVESMTRLDYITSAQEIVLYTDHANLLYIFDPYGRNPGIARHTANKLMRWAIKLGGFRYVIEHLSGERNVWADMLTRWAATPPNKVKTAKLARIMYAPITPSSTEQYDWPMFRDIIESQRKSTCSVPAGFSQHEGIIQDLNGVIWIPENDEILKLRILVASHYGPAGHRGIEPTAAGLKKEFFWKKMKDDIEFFCKSCIHCICTSTGEVVPRPLGHALHADKPNRILHFDYCYIGKSSTGLLYVLILKDDFSSFIWLLPCVQADSGTTAEALVSWFSSFGIVSQWVSDRGSHFKKEVIRAVREQPVILKRNMIFYRIIV